MPSKIFKLKNCDPRLNGTDMHAVSEIGPEVIPGPNIDYQKYFSTTPFGLISFDLFEVRGLKFEVTLEHNVSSLATGVTSNLELQTSNYFTLKATQNQMTFPGTWC